MKVIIQRLIDYEKMSNNHTEGIEDFSKTISINDDYIKYNFGSDYDTAEIAMSMKEEESNI